jgi:cytoskeletal protein CcmA (bactofilin family)
MRPRNSHYGTARSTIGGQPPEAIGPGQSVIGDDIVITGDIEATVDLRIDGKVVGDVRCATLILGENSCVTGHIFAARLKVFGKIDGVINASDVAVESTAAVSGELSYARLRVANGASVEGHLKRIVLPAPSGESETAMPPVARGETE